MPLKRANRKFAKTSQRDCFWREFAHASDFKNHFPVHAKDFRFSGDATLRNRDIMKLAQKNSIENFRERSLELNSARLLALPPCVERSQVCEHLDDISYSFFSF
jgi:hypothetical protein